MEFEWDENKNLANIKNHEGVSFYDAVKIFDDVGLSKILIPLIQLMKNDLQ